MTLGTFAAGLAIVAFTALLELTDRNNKVEENKFENSK